MNLRIVGFSKADDFIKRGDGLFDVALAIKGVAEVVKSAREIRIQPQGGLQADDGLVKLADGDQGSAEVGMGVGVSWACQLRRPRRSSIDGRFRTAPHFAQGDAPEAVVDAGVGFAEGDERARIRGDRLIVPVRSVRRNSANRAW